MSTLTAQLTSQANVHPFHFGNLVGEATNFSIWSFKMELVLEEIDEDL